MRSYLQEQHAEAGLRGGGIGRGLGEEDARHRGADAHARLPRVGAGGVAGGDVANLMAEHAGQFRLVVEVRQQAARDVDVAAGQRESVHRRDVDHREAPGQVGAFRGLRQAHADTLHVLLQPAVRVEAHLGPDLRVRLLAQLDLLSLTHQVVHRAGR